MHCALPTPYADCPFRTDITFRLQPDRVRTIWHALTHDQTFACYKTTHGHWTEEDRSEGEAEDVYHHTGDEQHCAGALILLERNGGWQQNFLLRLAYRGKLFRPERLNLDAPVFATPEAMIDRMEAIGQEGI